MNRIIHGWRGGSFQHSLLLLLHLDGIYGRDCEAESYVQDVRSGQT